ncbi:uncharacterized protein LOC110841697 [Folsomia candida]|uniref:SET domain-containing protein n=1 Tax=Folsomia candida TaxID=158441 RepID=A0A226EZC1_FOLCA|nr:uncharacterized protein LOC110841697 [Folsomia candida]OXA62889.1 hypothetical protein Fcan01_00024 [Folsomia candida]
MTKSKGKKKSGSRKKEEKVVDEVEKLENEDSPMQQGISEARQTTSALLTEANGLNDDLNKEVETTEPEKGAFGFCGKDRCKKCRKILEVEDSIGGVYCHFICPQNFVFCSEKCKEDDGHNCEPYEYRAKKEDRMVAEMQSTVDIPENSVLADMAIIIEIPCVAHYKNPKSIRSVIEVPCIQCSVVNQEKWVEKGEQEYGIFDIVKATDCKRCKWPVCPDCKQLHHKECKDDLAVFTRSFASRRLQHPIHLNQDSAFWMLGLMRLSILEQKNKDLFQKFELLMKERDSSSFELTRDDKLYYDKFLEEFQKHFRTLPLWSGLEIKRIMDALMYYRVHTASISWPGAHVGVVNKCVLLGVKLHFGCTPNIILTKELGASGVVLKTLKPVKQDEILSLGIYQDGTVPGFGVYLRERGPGHKKECTSSACMICTKKG